MNKLQKLSLVIHGALLGMVSEYCYKTSWEHLQEIYYIPIWLIPLQVLNIILEIFKK